MRHELTEMAAAWLADEAYGVTAMLPEVPRKAGDPPPPNIAVIGHEYRHDWVVNDEDPPAVPALIVAALEVTLDWAGWGLLNPPEGGTKGAALVIAYAARDALGAKARRDSAYTLAAIRMSLDALTNGTGRAAGATSLRGVEILQVLGVQEVPLKKALGRGSLAGAVVATCQVAVDRP